ncbi:MAG: hypothetical protein IK005_07720 [Paludibacteraceae bacterium]|nr:hypothetical protein [Paludibacteraceae bacterium]
MIAKVFFLIIFAMDKDKQKGDNRQGGLPAKEMFMFSFFGDGEQNLGG